MLRYIAKRVLSAIITIWFIMTLTFTLMNAIPGDICQRENERSGNYCKYESKIWS